MINLFLIPLFIFWQNIYVFPKQCYELITLASLFTKYSIFLFLRRCDFEFRREWPSDRPRRSYYFRYRRKVVNLGKWDRLISNSERSAIGSRRPTPQNKLIITFVLSEAPFHSCNNPKYLFDPEIITSQVSHKTWWLRYSYRTSNLDT